MYAAQVERLIGVFGRDRLLVLQYERCRASFLDEARRTYAFLGLDPEFVPPVATEQPRAPRESSSAGGAAPPGGAIRERRAPPGCPAAGDRPRALAEQKPLH